LEILDFYNRHADVYQNGNKSVRVGVEFDSFEPQANLTAS